MRIRAHPESHIVQLDDGSVWRIFPGDIDITLNWQPETELTIENIDDEISSHALVASADRSRVRVIPGAEHWPVREVKTVLKDG